MGRDTGLGEGFLVIDETVDDRGHRHAECGCAIIGRPAGLCHGAEIGKVRNVVYRGEIAVLEKLQRGVKGAAGDEIARAAGLELGVESRVILSRGGRRELHLDARVLRLESGNDLLLPECKIVIAPALDGQGGLGVGRRPRCQPGSRQPAEISSGDWTYGLSKDDAGPLQLSSSGDRNGPHPEGIDHWFNALSRGMKCSVGP